MLFLYVSKSLTLSFFNLLYALFLRLSFLRFPVIFFGPRINGRGTYFNRKFRRNTFSYLFSSFRIFNIFSNFKNCFNIFWDFKRVSKFFIVIYKCFLIFFTTIFNFSIVKSINFYCIGFCFFTSNESKIIRIIT